MTLSVPTDASPKDGPGPSTFLALAGVALSLLLYEILLTRVSSLRYHFHFSYLVVSNCLLMFGASGTALALTRSTWWQAPKPWLARLALAQAGSLGLAWAVVLWLPVHRGPMDATGIFSLLFFNVATAPPFFFGGAFVGLVLSRWGAQAGRLYGVDLVAAGIGCGLVPLLLPAIGAGGVLAGAVACTLGAAACMGPAQARVGALVCVLLVPVLDSVAPLPSKRGGPFLWSAWSTTSRVDVLELAPGERELVSLGAAHAGAELPPQVEVVQDGSASTFLADFSRHEESRALLLGSLYGVSAQLLEQPAVFVVGFGGGNDVWSVLEAGARSVRGVDMNPQMLRIHQEILPEYSRSLLADPRVHLTTEEGRSAWSRIEETFDLVQMSGIDTWAALTSGAYMLAENHLYTLEGFGGLLQRVRPGGLLQVVRMGAEMETLRLLALERAALKGRMQRPFADCVAVLGASHHLVSTVVAPEGFSPQQVAHLSRLVEEHGLEPIYIPGRSGDGLVEAFIRNPDPAGFIAAFPRDIRPPVDDRPYFFAFTRWDAPVRARETMREPTHVSQGNPLLILGQLALHGLAAFCLVWLPLRWRRAPIRGPGPFGLFFAGIGLGFILAELGLMQKMLLLLGHPGLSVPVSLGGLLVWAGLGARWSQDLEPSTLQGRIWGACIGGLVVGVGAMLPVCVTWSLGWSTPARVALALALLAAPGIAMGVPMALGIRRLESAHPESIPWAWAINGCLTVVGSIASVVVSMNLGFSWVLGFAALSYGGAFWFLPGGKEAA
jgi:hypothetical protein